jgi:hypothetical protein
MSRYQFIEQAGAAEPVQVLCCVLEVSTAGYYQWLGRVERLPTGSPRLLPPFRAMPSAMAPDACGRNYVPKATPSDAMPCAPGCVAGACARSVPDRNARALRWFSCAGHHWDVV